ncbi:MAG TPA: hypothetical protein VGV59_06095 [Pyrinomonadaceae bacterium]|nr:hypothetical protein [Pyrinomonadaceae bacterium]
MDISVQRTSTLFGLYELDQAGTVLYSRIETEGKTHDDAQDVSGCNFYEAVAHFANVEEFRQRINHFTQGGEPADNFKFDCQYQYGALHIRVLLARIRERSDNTRTKSVLVHIRKGS